MHLHDLLIRSNVVKYKVCQLTNVHERGITQDKYMYNDVKLSHRMCLIVMISFRLYTHLYHGRYTKVDTVQLFRLLMKH